MEKKVKKEKEVYEFKSFENDKGVTTAAHVWNVKKDNINWK